MATRHACDFECIGQSEPAGILRWFTGNIGLHFLHHIMPRIPNYNLQACYDATPQLHAVKPLTLRTSLRSAHLNLWDEQHHCMVSFRSFQEPQRTETHGRSAHQSLSSANSNSVTPPFWW